MIDLNGLWNFRLEEGQSIEAARSTRWPRSGISQLGQVGGTIWKTL